MKGVTGVSLAIGLILAAPVWAASRPVPIGPSVRIQSSGRILTQASQGDQGNQGNQGGQGDQGSDRGDKDKTVAFDQATYLGPDLGKVTRSGSVSMFKIDAVGTVTRMSGTTVRITTGPTSAPLIKVTCVSGRCNNGRLRLVFQAASGAGASIQSFTPGQVHGSGLTLVSAPGTTPMIFTSSGKNTSATFSLGMTVRVDPRVIQGTAQYPYTITATLD